MSAIRPTVTVMTVATGHDAVGRPATGQTHQGASPTDPVQENEKDVLFPSTSMISHGQEVAETACANCHGVDGISDSQGKPHLAGQRGIYLYRVQQAYQAGTRIDENKNHKAFLNDKSLLAVSAYYSSLTPAPNLEALTATPQADVPEEDPFLSIRDSMKRCIKCHGETGNAEGSETQDVGDANVGNAASW